MEENKGLVYVGKIINIEDIPNADFIVSATVICGKGGKWKGIIRKTDFVLNDECLVFLPDSLFNEVDHKDFPFMKDSNWRVKMRRYRGAPSEVLITKHFPITCNRSIGYDVTELVKVTKYCKPIPANLACDAKGNFPDFIPKTDEPNYQKVPELIECLEGFSYYITEKADGSSTTSFKYKGEFGVCSRNWELKRDENNGYWKIAIQYNLEEKLPDGIALQWETCGPKIQGNPYGFKDIHGLAFSAYNIPEGRYLTMYEFIGLCRSLNFPTVPILTMRQDFRKEGLELLGEGIYKNSGKQREGVVVRSQNNLLQHKPISFKIINLNYET
jgi:RNA ligase (TIGR02306 family)